MRNSSIFNKQLSKESVKSSALSDRNQEEGGTVEPKKLMSDLGYDMEPFMQDWVSEWANWDDNARPWQNLTLKRV